MIYTVRSLAKLVQGEVRGDANLSIGDANSIEAAGPEAVTFVLDDSHVSRLKNCRAGTIILTANIFEGLPATSSVSFILVTDPHAAFHKILPLFRKLRDRPERGTSPLAVIHPTAKIGLNCHVGPWVHIGEEAEVGNGCDIHPGVVIGAGCKLGDDVVLYPNVVLYHDVTIGSHSIIHSGAVIGADGFGYRFVDGRFEKIPQLGTVDIQADVEIGACTTIDRGAINATVIGAGTKIDNMVMIGHNCKIGQHNVFASQVGLAGSSSTGDYVRLGGQAGVKDHVHIGTGSTVGAKAGIHKDIPAGEFWIGYLATPEAEQKRLMLSLKRVPAMREQLKSLEQQLSALTLQMAALTNGTTEQRHRAE